LPGMGSECGETLCALARRKQSCGRVVLELFNAFAIFNQ
jgi:hypothetical protein